MTIRETRSYVLFTSRFGHWRAHFHACSTGARPTERHSCFHSALLGRSEELTAATDAYEDARSIDPTYDILRDDDAQLTLTLLYELHLQGIENVSDEWEWNPDLLAVRSRLEARFESGIAELVGEVPSSGDVVADLWAMTAPSAGPGLASFMAKDATVDQFAEVLIHRSLNQLREADVHTLGISRLSGAVKAALVEVQSDEYGGGRAERMHSRLLPTPCGLSVCRTATAITSMLFPRSPWRR
ncbi:hypothetical protein GCM10020255_056820 [Rhodococcus baikonurensis]